MMTDNTAFHDFLQRHIAKPLNQSWILAMALFSVIPVLLFGCIQNWYGAKSNPVWWSINPLYFWVIHSVTILIFWYVLCWALIRQVVVIRALYILFRDSEIRPKIMHPDGCMGFSPVGNYALFFCAPIVLVAFGWAMSLVFMPVTTGNEPTLFATTLCIAAYPIFLSAFIIAPTLAPHRPMKEARDVILETIAVQIRDCLGDLGKEPKTSNMDMVSALEHKYNMILDNYTTWPFRTRVLRTFCLVAVIPLLPTAVSIVLNALLKG